MKLSISPSKMAALKRDDKYFPGELQCPVGEVRVFFVKTSPKTTRSPFFWWDCDLENLGIEKKSLPL